MFTRTLSAVFRKNANKGVLFRTTNNCFPQNNLSMGRRFASTKGADFLVRKVPNKALKSLGCLAIAAIAGYTLYLDLTYTSRKDEALGKRVMEEKEYNNLKRKTKSLAALMADGEFPSTINFMFGEESLPNTYSVDVLGVLDHFLNHDQSGKFSSLLKEIMEQRKLNNVVELSDKLPTGLMSLMISKYISDRYQEITSPDSKLGSITISNAQYISLDELLKFEIDVAEVDELVLKKDQTEMNSLVVDYFDTVDKLKYI